MAHAFDRERVYECWPDLRPLTERHWREIAHYQDIPLNVSEYLYDAMERAGRFRLYTVRSDGILVGYAGFFVTRSTQHADSLQAVQDVLFLVPELRGRKVGLEFITWCDERLREEGVQVVYHHVKHTHNFGPLLASLGYESIGTVWGRRLDVER